jgi:hypothetical protein
MMGERTVLQEALFHELSLELHLSSLWCSSPYYRRSSRFLSAFAQPIAMHLGVTIYAKSQFDGDLGAIAKAYTVASFECRATARC